MVKSGAIISLGDWLQSPAGRCVAAWEQARLDEEVADVFGFHALQLGLPQIQGLRSNRMAHRWCAGPDLRSDPVAGPASGFTGRLACDYEALPFDSASMDLVVLPHSLEWADDPHATLREVERVLRPQGRVIITGFNPASLWAWRQRLGRWRRQGVPAWDSPLFMPERGEFLADRRLRDWLSLLSFERESEHFGCYRWPARSEAWLERMAWMERQVPRAWPSLGAVYLIRAVKCVRGMRLLGLAKRHARHRAVKAVAAVRRSRS
jgi:SAM-dependent methyltransferase